MSLFRTLVLQEKTQKTLTSLRYRIFTIGGYFEKPVGRLALKIALNKRRRLGSPDFGIKTPFIRSYIQSVI